MISAISLTDDTGSDAPNVPPPIRLRRTSSYFINSTRFDDKSHRMLSKEEPSFTSRPSEALKLKRRNELVVRRCRLTQG